MLSSAPWLCSVVVLQATPWMFDFDVSHADNPSAVSSGLNDLSDGLPQPPEDQLSEVQLDDVTLYFFTEMLEVYEQARDSGPQIAGPLERNATLCADHQAFTVPILVADSGGSCAQSAQQITDILNAGIDACMYTEFPELYVYDQPGAQVLPDTLDSFEGLIAYAGEALTHIDDYPVELMVPGFWETARGILAKLRFLTLRDRLDEAVADYGHAQSLLDNGCFDPTTAATVSADLDDLTVEAVAVRGWLVDLYADGLAQAAADRAALLAQGRTRAELPGPFSDWEREWLAFYVAGVYWRIRGAGLINNPPEDEPGETILRRTW